MWNLLHKCCLISVILKFKGTRWTDRFASCSIYLSTTHLLTSETSFVHGSSLVLKHGRSHFYRVIACCISVRMQAYDFCWNFNLDSKFLYTGMVILRTFFRSQIGSCINLNVKLFQDLTKID